VQAWRNTRSFADIDRDATTASSRHETHFRRRKNHFLATREGAVTMSSAARHRAAVLKAYRDFVDVARRSRPVAEREAKLEEARAAIRASAGVTDESEQQALLKKLVARVGFLRVVTPKTGRGRHKRESGVFVVREGEVVEGSGQSAGQRVADGTISMQEAHEYHNRLLKRQYYGQTPPPQPPML
jgi:hypothetical protein